MCIFFIFLRLCSFFFISRSLHFSLLFSSFFNLCFFLYFSIFFHFSFFSIFLFLFLFSGAQNLFFDLKCFTISAVGGLFPLLTPFLHVFHFFCFVFPIFCCFFLKNVFLLFFENMPLLAFVSGKNKRCFLRCRCSMEMWCLDDIVRDSWDWVGPPTWVRACFNSPEWGGGSSPVKNGASPDCTIVLLYYCCLLLLLFATR